MRGVGRRKVGVMRRGLRQIPRRRGRSRRRRKGNDGTRRRRNRNRHQDRGRGDKRRSVVGGKRGQRPPTEVRSRGPKGRGGSGGGNRKGRETEHKTRGFTYGCSRSSGWSHRYNVRHRSSPVLLLGKGGRNPVPNSRRRANYNTHPPPKLDWTHLQVASSCTSSCFRRKPIVWGTTSHTHYRYPWGYTICHDIEGKVGGDPAQGETCDAHMSYPPSQHTNVEAKP